MTHKTTHKTRGSLNVCWISLLTLSVLTTIHGIVPALAEESDPELEAAQAEKARGYKKFYETLSTSPTPKSLQEQNALLDATLKSSQSRIDGIINDRLKSERFLGLDGKSVWPDGVVLDSKSPEHKARLSNPGSIAPDGSIVGGALPTSDLKAKGVSTSAGPDGHKAGGTDEKGASAQRRGRPGLNLDEEPTVQETQAPLDANGIPKEIVFPGKKRK